MRGTSVTDAGLQQMRGLTALRVLGLSDTGVTDAGLAHVLGLPRLQALFLDGTRVTERFTHEIESTYPALTISR